MFSRYAGRIFLAAIVAAVSVLALAAIGEKKATGPFADAGADVAATAEAAKSRRLRSDRQARCPRVNVDKKAQGRRFPH